MVKIAVAIPEEGERVEKSLGILIKSIFTEQDFFSVVGATEIPARAIPSLVLLLTNQRIMEIRSTPDPDLVEWGDTELAAVEEERERDKWRMRQLLEEDPKAMLAAIEYGHNFYYALCMRSKDRKGRAEAVRLGTGSMIRETQEGLGLGTRMLHAMGLGRLTKYEKVYLKKGEQ